MHFTRTCHAILQSYGEISKEFPKFAESNVQDPNVAAAHLNSILADDATSQQQDLANQIAQQQTQQLALNGQPGITGLACLITRS